MQTKTWMKVQSMFIKQLLNFECYSMYKKAIGVNYTKSSSVCILFFVCTSPFLRSQFLTWGKRNASKAQISKTLSLGSSSPLVAFSQAVVLYKRGERKG